jgi:hypothetical protein
MLNSVGVNISKLFTLILLLIRYGAAVYFAGDGDIIKNCLIFSPRRRRNRGTYHKQNRLHTEDKNKKYLQNLIFAAYFRFS